MLDYNFLTYFLKCKILNTIITFVIHKTYVVRDFYSEQSITLHASICANMEIVVNSATRFTRSVTGLLF